MAGFRMNLDDGFFSDGRIKVLARLSGESEHAARGRLILLWAHCYRHRKSVVDTARINFQVEWDGEGDYVKFLVGSHLADPADHPELFSIAGVEERIQYLIDLEHSRASSASKAGKASAERRKLVAVANVGPTESNDTSTTVQRNPTDSTGSLSVSSSVSFKKINTNTAGEENTIGLPGVTAEAVKECGNLWLETLRFHGSERGLNLADETRLGQAVKRFGKDAVLLAILGAKYEPSSDSFKPSIHLSLARIFHPEKNERFVNMGAQARKKLAAKAAEAARLAEPLPDEPPPDPERVKALFDAAFGRDPKGDA